MTVVYTTNGVSRHNDVITGKIMLYMTFFQPPKIFASNFHFDGSFACMDYMDFFQDKYTIFSEYNTFCFQYGIKTLLKHNFHV